MAETVRAVCPNCQNALKIPAAWADKALKCKKCGAVIQGKKGASGPVQTAQRAPKPEPVAAAPAPAAVPVPAAPAPAPVQPVAAAPVMPDPAAPPVPGYPPQPYPGYPPQPGYPYPGYGYAPPPGYPAPAPGYPAPPPGYGYAPPQPGYAPPGYGYAPPPGYPDPNAAGYPPQPGMMPPAPVNPSNFLPEPEVGAGRRRPKKSGPGKYVAAAIGLLLAVGLGVAGLKYRDQIKGFVGAGGPAAATDKSAGPGVKPVVNTGFPRRMLVMSVSKYLFCNGLTNGPFDPTGPDSKRAAQFGDRVSEVARRLAFDWRVPTEKDNNQLYVLSDTAGKDPRPMLKPVILDTYARFLDTCRPHDHAVIYFGGHAVEKDGKAYLVPVEGDLDDPDTLIPLAEFYAKLASCKARQKAILFDVCRLNEADDMVRHGSEPMSEGLEKALLAVPPGVQVMLACSAGQRAIEFRNTPVSRTDPKDPVRNVLGDVYGSLLLSALNHAGSSGKAKADKNAPPTEAIPLELWAAAAKDRAAEVARLAGKPDPMVKFAGFGPSGPAEVPADAVALKRFDVATPPTGLPKTEVARLVDPVNLPSIRPSLSAGDEPIQDVIPFSPEVMRAYLADGGPPAGEIDPEKYPVRKVAFDALKYMRAEWGSAAGKPGEPKLRDRFEGETDDGVKKVITAEQEVPARIILELEEFAQTMDAAMESLDKEPSKYWQVTFLYAMAEVKARLAFMHEYDLLLAGIKTESLPELDKTKGQTGYQMVSNEKLKSKKDIRELADAARELFGKIAEEHKGTPWAVYAKRTKTVSLGLEWRPYTPPSMVRDE